jgi:sigma-B regulation protein RsbU (phosphoserine phosphatase)
MGSSAATGGLAAVRRASDVSAPPARTQTRRRDLELKLDALQKDYAELHTAIFEAAQVHRRLCAPRLVRAGDFEIASEIFAVRHLPGDFFTAHSKGEQLMFTLGDISGKGLAAGMWTTHLVGLTNSYAAINSDPKKIVAGVNHDLCSMPLTMSLASLFLARLDPGTGILEYCSAGHPPALLLRANGDLESLSEGGLLLGVTSDAIYYSAKVQLGPDDVLLVYSDGIIESLNEEGDEFGGARLREHLRLAHSQSADAILFSVLGAVQDFAGTRPLMDDMTLAVVRRTSAAKPTVLN